MMDKHKIRALIFLVAAAAVAGYSSLEFYHQQEKEPLYPSEYLTSKRMLSYYHPGIPDAADTEVYIFDSGVPGATLFLAGGTHPNEPAGYIAAAVILENLKAEAGRVILIPRSNISAFSHNDPMEGFPGKYTLQTNSGEREFRIGSRLSNPLHQWPDPLVYIQYPSGQKLSGFEARNLNRTFPGREGGTFTEEIAFGILQLIKKEQVSVAIDLHEAAPEIPIINAIVYHEKCEEMALNAVLALEFEGLSYSPERSPENFRGLTHREWGDYSDANPFLMETCNPIQGRLRGKTDADLVVKGVSEFYKSAKESGKLRIEYDINGEPLWRRVARHTEGFKAIINAYNEAHPGSMILVSGIPSYAELEAQGAGAFLR